MQIVVIGIFFFDLFEIVEPFFLSYPPYPMIRVIFFISARPTQTFGPFFFHLIAGTRLEVKLLEKNKKTGNQILTALIAKNEPVIVKITHALGVVILCVQIVSSNIL